MNDFDQKFIEQVIQTTKDSKMLDMRYFAPYSRRFGFKISVDGLHNTPHPLPYGVVVSLNPPGELYADPEPRPSKDVNVATTMDLESPMRSYRFLDGYFHFRDVPGTPNLAVVLDIRSIEYVRGTPKIVEAGWTLVPVFFIRDARLYVRSGIYQMPVFKGPVDREMIAEMAQYEDQWNFLQERLVERRGITLYQPFSVIVRLLAPRMQAKFVNYGDPAFNHRVTVYFCGVYFCGVLFLPSIILRTISVTSSL